MMPFGQFAFALCRPSSFITASYFGANPSKLHD
jgi:hypothetical protein